jgi:pilus assembly protein CpaC
MLRVTVAEVNRAAARSIGLNFAINNRHGIGIFANNTGLIATGGAAPGFTGNGFGTGFFGFNATNNFGIPPFAGFAAGSGGFNNLPAALDNGQISLAISALRTLNYARSLAEPTLVAINGQTARFKAGGEFPVPVVTGYTAAGLQGVEFYPYGVQLQFTPFITDRDRIRLVIGAVVSTRDLSAGVTTINGTAIPSLSTRDFQTVVELREGQTLAVAGLIQNNLGADASRIPLFGDLPILNRLLGFDRITAGEQELVVLVTPELVHPMEHNEVPALPGADIFEPNDCEFYLLGHLEGHAPVDWRSPVRTDWQRLHQDYESLYLFGPQGYVPEQQH